jgi:kynureninase
MTFEEFARQLDSEDKLNKYRDEFIFQKWMIKVIYFTGNSLGLQPKELDLCRWSNGWLGKPSGRRTFYAEKPWWDYHERLKH